MSRKRGRPEWQPTEKDRAQVKTMVATGLPEVTIALIIGVSPHTLRKHCREELDTELAKMKARVGQFILQSILGMEGGIKNDATRGALAMFYAKTQMGWKETVVQERPDDTRAADELTDAELEAIVRRRRTERAKAVVRVKEDGAPRSTAVH